MKIKTTARFAGLLYLLIAVFGGFAFFAGYEGLIVKGNAIATTNNIINSELMFRVGILGDSFTFMGEIVLTILLYKLFKPVGKTLSQIAAFSRLAMTTMIGMNVLNKLLVLQLLSGVDYLSVFLFDMARCNCSPNDPREGPVSLENFCQFCSSSVLPGFRVIFLSPVLMASIITGIGSPSFSFSSSDDLPDLASLDIGSRPVMPGSRLIK